MSKTSRLLLVLAAFLAGLAAFAGVVLIVTQRGPASIGPAAAAIGGPFQLIDQDGRPFNDANMKGHPFLVFFGFTHCPDVCPTTLFEVSDALRKLGRDADRSSTDNP
jgi:protein SCO1/2